MLLLHQVGSVKIGEVVRYTVTYTPSQDRILPSPEKLYVRIRNTSAIALRAAFVHGPYTLSVSAYPAAFDPDAKFDNPRRYGLPTFEPMLKAGGSWECELFVPDNIRQAADTGRHGTFGNGLGHDAESSTWIIEVTSQVVFSSSAAVGYEIIVARDPKSLNLTQSLSIVGGHSQVHQPGKVSDHQKSIGAKDGHHLAQTKGVFSRAISIKVEDTATLWNTPRLPGWDDAGEERLQSRSPANRPVESVIKTQRVETDEPKPSRKRRKVHLVILTHGLHSNLGADMLFMKERIDATAKQAKLDAKVRRAKERQRRQAPSPKHSDSLPGKSVIKANSGPKDKQEEDGQPMEDDDGGGDDDDAAGDEEVIVRGYSGNAKKTERGIKYLGKRLARYVLSMTYPDQPYFPVVKGTGHGYPQGTKTEKPDQDCREAHKHSSVVMDADRTPRKSHHRPYRIASISFVAHSLGGLVQMYAVAYIQKHSPRFFDVIKPINFIALATPFLGLSNENPLYVKFALDFGLVGRTGQDLGLTWRAPTIARSGWGAIVSNLGESAHRKVYGETQPESKPLLRILPTGPAHTALMKFRNRTVYSNVVNDGIVPLRTSCLLFLDWQGLGRVEKARRDAGLVETVVGFGWAELTGANMVSPRHRQLSVDDHPTDSGNTTPRDNMREVPQPPSEAMGEDDKASVHSMPFAYKDDEALTASSNGTNNAGPLAGFFNLFRSSEPLKAQPLSLKQKRILRRGQTMPLDQAPPGEAGSPGSEDGGRTPKVTSGHELEDEQEAMNAPPKTTFFESAGDVLNPSMPGVEYLIDPTTRPRAIFHDRVYHPTDIPPPPLKKRHSTFSRRKPTTRNSSLSQQSASSSSSSNPSSPHPHPIQEDPPTSPVKDDEAASRSPDRMPGDAVDLSSMRVEEKIARGYHRELSWRKVLVKLEPDAHNNIFVRRMFANAYGWPVIKHMVDAHFSDSAIARMRTEDEHLGERALDMGQPPDEHGAETKPAPLPTSHDEDDAAARDAREALDEVPDLPSSKTHASATPLPRGPPERADSVIWSEHDWIDSDNDSDTLTSRPRVSPRTGTAAAHSRNRSQAR